MLKISRDASGETYEGTFVNPINNQVVMEGDGYEFDEFLDFAVDLRMAITVGNLVDFDSKELTRLRETYLEKIRAEIMVSED